MYHFTVTNTSIDRVPTWTGTPGKMGRHFPVREFQTDWKVGENHTKCWKTHGVSNKCYL